MMVRKATQFAVSVEDRPGILAEITEVLAAEGINLISLVGWSAGGGRAVIMGIPDDPDKVRALAAGQDVQESEVVLVEGDDQPGAGHAIARKIAGAGVGMQAFVAQAVGGKFQAIISVAPEDIEKVVNALAG